LALLLPWQLTTALQLLPVCRRCRCQLLVPTLLLLLLLAVEQVLQLLLLKQQRFSCFIFEGVLLVVCITLDVVEVASDVTLQQQTQTSSSLAAALYLLHLRSSSSRKHIQACKRTAAAHAAMKTDT
jgi:hypothetical protein